MTDWTIKRARATYSIPHWGNDYFDVNEHGHIVVRPRSDGDTEVDLYELTHQLNDAGVSLPALLRFTDILHDRVSRLSQVFANAMAAADYHAQYHAVYPIKVNQQRSVVEEILAADPTSIGLEAGSKPELMIVLALSASPVICNGYKDREYIRLALIGAQLGHQVYIVIEKLSELELVIAESRALGVRPLLGMRVRLASIGKGKWQNSGGEKSKFGLSSVQMLSMIERLREAGMLDCLTLMHVHLGSQIANIRDIQSGIQEAARCYAELHRLGAPIACIDVGGGLGVDYEGTRTRSFCSMNYSLQEYANNIIRTLSEVCAVNDLPQPDLITESGRSMAAYHAVLITEVVNVERVPEMPPLPARDANEHYVITDLRRGLEDCEAQEQGRSAIELYHDAVHGLSQAREMFSHGVLNLEQRALAEQIYYLICRKVLPRLQSSSRMHRDVIDELHETLADKYFCNFSVFQSIPDVWAIDQVFPVVPLHRLDEEPLRRAVITDISCDSDGRIDLYVDNAGIETTLPLHTVKDGEPYLIGLFLVGAYQEILGDMHNLFGDTNSVNISLQQDGSCQWSVIQQGDTVASVLRYVNFDADELLQAYRDKLEATDLHGSRKQDFFQELKAGLAGYTYLED